MIGGRVLCFLVDGSDQRTSRALISGRFKDIQPPGITYDGVLSARCILFVVGISHVKKCVF